MPTLPANSFDKISPTALLTAYARQFSDIPYTKEIAEQTNALATVKQFVQEGQKQPVVVGALIEARYKAIDQVMSRFNPSQILELASGLLPRGMIWSQHADVTFIESDLPEMIDRKQQLVQQLIGDRPNLHFLAIDATSRPNPLLLQGSYLNPEKPVTVLCEGLLMYLTFAEKQLVFANVRELLQRCGGVWITSDLTTEERTEQLQANDPALGQVRQKIVSATGRAFADNQFNDAEHIQQFVQEQGFRVERFSMLEVIDRLECLSALEIDLEQAKLLLATTPVVALTLA